MTSLELKKDFDKIRSWNYRRSCVVGHGFMFYVDTPSGHPGKVLVGEQGSNFKISFEIRKLNMLQEIEYVPKEDLIEVIDCLIKGKLNEKKHKALKEKWAIKDKESKEKSAKKLFESIRCNVLGKKTCYRSVNRKGVIITHDKVKSKFDSAKCYLDYDALKATGKLEEITVDSTWKQCLTDRDPRPFVGRIAAAAYRAHGGLLIVNINIVDAFAKCEYWRKLAEQESYLIDYAYDKNQFKDFINAIKGKDVDAKEFLENYKRENGDYHFKFEGYVLLVVNVDWDQFKDMERYYYTF